MSNIIKLLPENVANQIAAGEVVQRPASVVKELLENAIDAGATHVQLIVKNAGKMLIQVVDDGCGMSQADARMSLERHATSKISSAEDLFNLHTKGFRGEALASIAAVSQLELKTKLHDADTGIKVNIEASKVVSETPEAMQGGTSFSVKNLFFNIPARRNFLKKDSTELVHIIEEFTRVAMVHHDVRFTMHNNGSVMYDLPPATRKKRISNLSGSKTEEKLVEVKEYTDIISIEGYIIRPEYCRKTKEDQYFFVNGRFIRSGYLHHAVKTSMDGLIPSDHQVGYYLYITVPPETLDVNIHPTKTEVKFEDEKTVYAILKSAIRQGLAQHKVTPSIDFEQEKVFDSNFSKDRDLVPPTIKVNPDFNPFDEEKNSPSRGGGSGFSKSSAPKTDNWEQFYDIEEAPEQEQQSIEIPQGEEDEESRQESVTTQLHQTYILTQLKSGFLIIDQKNAHERILYEKFIQQMALNQSSTQQLLFPHEQAITAKEHTLIDANKEALQSLGLDYELQTTKWIINGIPTSENNLSPEQFINELLSEMTTIDENGLRDKKNMAAGIARVMAVKRGKKLSEAEMKHLVDQLFACENPNYSPSGKPTIVTFTTEFLKQQFNS